MMLPIDRPSCSPTLCCTTMGNAELTCSYCLRGHQQYLRHLFL